ncbi:tetratricopeptide repeat protein [Azospirillum sp.]|uniref:tetratricopeptide repeat protein n=1 Tax=Azospirillum sp. TaxID=34012 RepID=UPI002D6681E2|nr:tetratricopeptide repeat protein [Azospirillum sp.]HYD68410.1 tetratricopeptide repeat protein [Azospirillum sp.]
MLLAALLMAAQPAHAQKAPPAMAVDAVREDVAARLTLSWAQAVTVERQQQGRELTLRFSRPIGDAKGIEGIPDRLSGWVENTQYGYDSLLLVLAPDVAVNAEAQRTGVRLDFTRAAPVTRERAEAEVNAERRLDYYRALATLEEGEVRAARERLRGLVAANPRDREMVELLAQAEERLGRWREAVRLYDRALVLSPDRVEAAEAKARLLREYGEQVRLDFDLFRVKNADVQRVTRLTGVKELGADTAFRFALENRIVDVDQVPRRDGPPQAFHGRRSRAELSVVHDWDEPQQTRASLFLAERTVGLGVGHSVTHGSGETRAALHVQEPTYTFIEGIVGAGRRDRVMVAHDERLWQGLAASLGGAVNRYGLAGDPNLARSASVEGWVRYTFNDEGPIASVAYVLDAEYVADKTERIDPRGNVQAPLPLVSREVHSLQLAVDHPVTDWFRYNLQAGWSHDRRNEGGPFAAAQVAFAPLPELEFGLRASHTISTARGTGNTVRAAGGYLLWRY